jgi:hypothetical protein
MPDTTQLPGRQRIAQALRPGQLRDDYRLSGADVTGIGLPTISASSLIM